MSAEPKTLICTSTLPLELGDGQPRFVYDLAKALTEYSPTTVLAPGAHGYTLSENMEKVAVKRFHYFFPTSLQRLVYYRSGMLDAVRNSFLAKLQIPFFVRAQSKTISQLVKSEGINVVNSHWIVPQGLSTALARGKTNRFKHVLSIHAGDVYLLKRIPFGRAIARYVLRRTDYVFAAGSHVRDTLVDLAGFDFPNSLQPMGVYTKTFASPREAAENQSPFPAGHILYIGRFVPKKGVRFLLDALPKIIKQHPGLGLVIVGYGTGEEQLHAQVAELNLGDSVVFTGRKTHTEISSYLQTAKVLVVPSIVDKFGETEGMPTVITEAMAAGTKVVASNVGGAADVIEDGVNGWLCCEKDADDLAEKVLSALAHTDNDAIRQAGIVTASKLDWSEVAKNYFELFQRVGSS